MANVHIPPQLIGIGAVLLIGLIVLLLVKARQNSPYYRSVTPHAETVEQVEGGHRELIEKRNRKAARIGWLIFAVIAIFACSLFALRDPAKKVQAAFWPTATGTPTITPSVTATWTLRPTSAYTFTPGSSPVASVTGTRGTAAATAAGTQIQPTARIIYQSITQLVTVRETVVVQHTIFAPVTVIVPQTVIVYQTVLVTPMDTATPTETGTATETQTPTATATLTETPTETATATP